MLLFALAEESLRWLSASVLDLGVARGEELENNMKTERANRG